MFSVLREHLNLVKEDKRFLCAFCHLGIEMKFILAFSSIDDIVNYDFTVFVVHCDSWLDRCDREEIRSSDDHVRIYISSGSCQENKTSVYFFPYLPECFQVLLPSWIVGQHFSLFFHEWRSGVSHAKGRLWLRGRVVVLQPEGRQFDPPSSKSTCRSVLEQDAEPRIALIEQQSAANRCTVWMCVWMGEWKTVL